MFIIPLFQVTHLLYCFLVSPKCELFKEISTHENADGLSKLITIDQGWSL